LGFWKWQGFDVATSTSVLPLGADFDGSNRSSMKEAPPDPVLVCVGIVEPRKNQTFLLDVAESLWAQGITFELHLVGRVNPHFGREIVKRVSSLQKRFPQLHFHEAASDKVFAGLLERARAVVFPTIAEGCGLPVLEALWRGLPCVCSDLPVLMEHTQAGGCLSLKTNDLAEWENGLTQILSDDKLWGDLAQQAATRELTTWADSAAEIRRQLD
jgi:glycosyltransferase involved in cell wall biosynthesis